MRRVAAWALAATLLAPLAGAQSLSDRLADLSFPEVVVTVAPQRIELAAHQAAISGETAADLRGCIDGSSCPDANLAAISPGNGDGTVDAVEVEAFEEIAVEALNLLAGDLRALRESFLDIVTVDDQRARSAKFVHLDLVDAEANAASTARILVSLTIHLEFPDVADRGTHEVRVQRDAPSLTLFERITLQAGSGWRIDEGSIQPASMQARFQDGRFSGSQADLAGPEPLTFQLEKAGLGAWFWVALASFVLVAGGLGALWYARRRRGRKA